MISWLHRCQSKTENLNLTLNHLKPFVGPNKTKLITRSWLMKNNVYSTFASTFISDSSFWKIFPDFWSMNPSISKSDLFDPSFFETAWINGAEFIECFVCHHSSLSLIVFSCKFKFFIKSFFSATLHTLEMPLKPCCSKENLFIILNRSVFGLWTNQSPSFKHQYETSSMISNILK